jgi:hypothetical protein
VSDWNRKGWRALAVGLVSLSTFVRAESPPPHPPTPGSPLSRDEMAVYDAVLSSWLGKDRGPNLLDERLSAAPSDADPQIRDCTGDQHFAARQGPKSLAGVRFARRGIELTDGSRWRPTDPLQAMARGDSVDAAVRKSFSRALMSFSQIAFSTDGDDALVAFSMTCGSLCGSGSTIRLHRSGKDWSIVRRCARWNS